MRITRHIKEGLIGLFRHSAMTISSAASVSVALLFVGVFVVLSENIREISYSIEEGVQIHVRVDQEYENQSDIDRMMIEITSIQGVKTVVFSSKDEELELLILSYGEDGAVLEPYRGDANPMRHAFLVEVIDGSLIALVADNIERIVGIEKINYGGVRTQQLVSMLDSIRKSGYILVAGLAIVAIFLISNTIKLSIASRNNEIAIMRSVGAKNGFIRAPFLIEGMLIGLFGSILPVGVTVAGYMYLYDLLGGVFISQMFVLQNPYPLVAYTGAALTGVAMFVGLVGSFISVTKHLRWKR